MPSEALKGIRVLDLSRILAAPYCTQLLGDLGAEVIKVERPGSGDDSRSYGPPFVNDAKGNPTADAGFYLSCNRNKRGITVDHSKPEGAALLRELAAKSDVFIENFRTGVLAKYGLDYESLKAINPGLIYCSVTGFGQDGPFSARPGYDGVFQAMCGMMSVSGLPDGVPGGGPMKVGVSMVDILTGLYASSAILAALRHRDNTGEGQFIDMALLDCGLASLSHYVQNYLISGNVPERRGNGGFGGIPSQTFKCSDREIFIVASTNKQFGALMRVLGEPELASDPRFDAVQKRITNRDTLLAKLDALFLKRSAAEWLEDLEEADVPASPVNDVSMVFDNPQIQYREMLAHTHHQVAGELPILRNPIRMSATPIGEATAPPTLGQDNDAVLREVLGYNAEKIAHLRACAVL
ncbi:CaiB/BaiF CoA transferase family protein [Novosphingobium taihuense]|uniref:Crotonobetainyl-CoA:carnitine CoA-transferase CaiB-like acyl-CoA transferase n=1 Tax=Novosphingobium taihuense TaxID=260085 RepID=A0A7W7ADU2_9SPHN|nr:CoA transferase [Novosphingobium taihuense]MBB4615056.1 crotonobetainyl-CoA:carnitine CoA-transferase CaiB-like acyl-CoA transferase [Novosphingobium taihuense]TWH79289.1 crotonobetainyl-CoA:carnitine CoA-transferase CaiB-like acyl-CoA transferase [Novosphingobium taihuense]